MPKTGQDIVKEQLGELTFQLCCLDADRVNLLEENKKLKEENAMLLHKLEIAVGIDHPPQLQPAPQAGHPGNIVRNPDKPKLQEVNQNSKPSLIEKGTN